MFQVELIFEGQTLHLKKSEFLEGFKTFQKTTA